MLSAVALILLASCATPPLPIAPSKFSPEPWGGNSIVGTSYGRLEGKSEDASTFAWLGIPYAMPPVGDLRWQAPRPPEPWQGLREARRYGAKSMQRSSLTGVPLGSEDSLFLNIWRPATGERDLPVYIWIHGGGNTSGASNAAPEYRGNALASKANLVFVSVNYRLDVFGWFAHPALKTGDPETDSGNFGTLDLIAALRWVRENISAFGGNPGNVTIAGESAGALNVLTLLIAPKAKGLFHKAIVESGYTQRAKFEPGDFAQNLARKLIIQQGKANSEKKADETLASMSKPELAKWLRSASPGELLRLSKPAKKNILSLPYPIFDGTVLPADGFAALADPERRAKVPLMIGTNRDETKLFLMFSRQNTGGPLYQKLARVTSDVWKAEGADAIADAFDALSADRQVFLYRFDWGSLDENGKSVMGGRTGEKLGAAHGVEISFFLQTDSVFGNILPLRILTKANEKGRLDLQAKMGRYLSNFVRTGDPNGPGGGATADLPLWTAWDANLASPPFIVFNAGLNEANIRTEHGRLIKASILKDFETESSAATQAKLKDFSQLLE